MKKWISVLCAFSLCLMLAGCTAVEKNSTSNSLEKVEQLKGDSGTYWIFSQKESSGKTLYGIASEDNKEIVPATYTYYEKLADDRVEVRVEEDYGDILNERGDMVFSNTRFVVVGDGVIPNKNWGEDTFDNQKAPSAYRLIRPATTPDAAVPKDIANQNAEDGPFQLKDIYGNTYGETYDQMIFTDREEVIGQNQNGYFLLDLNGEVVRKLDDAEEVSKPLDGKVSVTRQYRWNTGKTSPTPYDAPLYGIHAADGTTILEDKFAEVYVLSEERFVGCYPNEILYMLDFSMTAYTCIVDRTGKVICDEYDHMYVFDKDSESHYPYMIADIIEGETAGKGRFYIIDQNGDKAMDEAFDKYAVDANTGIATMTRADGSTLTVSLETGKIVA